ncbi:uncharacterized protein C2orf50 homolog isoform X1 [Gadus chalcogrammus]|uniref:uncharacterized protein C2orf50 homolog isoform X1 n=2 Tax=Gadus chalcogrammus TaxID=1042646 RepID=UPI0024C2D5E5|nr:uncharacterized protein C2orf50 homolog isoform X1 [Gadus chalcogrammus]
MELNDLRRVSSAAYRLPDRPIGGIPNATKHLGLVRKAPKNNSKEDGPSVEHPSKSDPLIQDQIWRECVQSEMSAVRKWEKNWSFLKNYDQLGRPRVDEPVPINMSPFSDKVPHTTNRMLGSRIDTPLGREVMRLDRLMLLSSSRRSKPDPEFLPS